MEMVTLWVLRHDETTITQVTDDGDHQNSEEIHYGAGLPCQPVLMASETRTLGSPSQQQSESAVTECRTKFGTFPECPLCGSELHPEHAHFKCRGCGWRDSCCD